MLQQLARHGDTLPTAWRERLVELADEPAFAEDAAVGLAQVKPHRSMVPPMVRRLTARLDAADPFRSSDDEIALAVLAKCADARATDVLVRLLEAPRVAHWDLMLEACVRTKSKAMVPAIRAWLRRAKQNGATPKWDGFVEGRGAIDRLR